VCWREALGWVRATGCVEHGGAGWNWLEGGDWVLVVRGDGLEREGGGGWWGVVVRSLG
jgi:hypothetical protein